VKDSRGTRAAAQSRRFMGPILRTWYDVTVAGAERFPGQGPVIVVANHPGALDAGLMLSACPRPVRILDADDVFVPALDRVFDLTGRIKVNLPGPDLSAIAQAKQVLSAGEALVVFPEPVRGDGRVVRIRHEAAYLALHSDAVLMPAAVLGTLAPGMASDALPKRGTALTVVFGMPHRVATVADPCNRRAIAVTAEGIRQRLADHVAQASADFHTTLPGEAGPQLTAGKRRRQERLP